MEFILRTGVSWRDLPEEYGNWHTIYTRYNRWSENGFFWRLLYQLQSLKQLLMDIVFVDGSIIPLHRHGGGALKKKGIQAIGRGKKGLGTTMHVAITPNAFINCQLFPAQRQDCKTVEQLWQDWPWEKISFVVADKGYNTGYIRNFIKSKGATPVIPLKGVYLPNVY